MVAELADGRGIAVPTSWYPRLARGTTEQRETWEIIGDGIGIHWPELDEDLSVRGLLRGTPAPQLRRRKAARTQEKPAGPLETTPFDVEDCLDSPETILAHLETVFEDGDPELIALVLNNVARARGLELRALTAHSDISSVIRTLKALGLELAARAA
jgi:hypothetical protein